MLAFLAAAARSYVCAPMPRPPCMYPSEGASGCLSVRR